MTVPRLILRSLFYFRAPHAALLAGMMLVTAVLTGALVLGDSVRASLSTLAAQRRGGYETFTTANAFFGEALADRLATHGNCDAGLALQGRVRSERTALSAGAQVLAVPRAAPVPRNASWITRTVAQSLNLRQGDTLLITLPGAGGASDAVLARRDRTSLASLRVTVDRILDDRADAFLAWFDLHPSQRPPFNVWLNIAELQDALLADVPLVNRIPASPANLLLHPSVPRGSQVPPTFPPAETLTLEDYGLGLSHAGGEVILHSGNLYIPPPIAHALRPFAAQKVYALLLDHVAIPDSQVPPLNYVVAAGIEGHPGLALKPDEVAINQWAANQLRLNLGDALQVAPYRLQADGTVTIADRLTVQVARILPMSGLGADPSLTPAFHGLTDADTIANWNPPAGFPFDSRRVTPADEAYWHDHKAAPKLFFNLLTAQRLVKPPTPPPSNDYAAVRERAEVAAELPAGELTSVRLAAEQADTFQRDLLHALTPAHAGFVSRPFAPPQPPSTDFAALFLGLSGFLLIAALLLVILLFRLAVEQRARQIGLLGALGFTPRRIARLIFAEGALVALAGTLAGLPLAILYTRLLVAGLGTWWIGATGTRAIQLHLHPATLAFGSAASLAAALAALALAARGFARGMPMHRMRGLHETTPRTPTRRSRAKATALATIAILAALAPVALASAGRLQPAIAFFLSGFLLLALAIAALAQLPAASRRVRSSLADIAAAGILRQRTRAMLCIALVAAATFLLASVSAFQSGPTSPTRPPSPTGGYQLILSTTIPLPANLQTPAGRRLLGVPDDPRFMEACFTPLLVRRGDDVSCLNMLRPTSPTLVGVPPEVLDRLAIAGRVNHPPDSHAIPAAVDRQTAQYILHTGLGEPLPSPPPLQRPIIIERLLKDTIFQSYVLIPEHDFRAAFPEITRSSLVLVDCPPLLAPSFRAQLRQSLDDYGVTIETTTERLAAYHAVADSYIAAFQLLGSLGLLIGALGLVVVLARNVIQRRAELALLQALGFTRRRVTAMLLIEHALLLLIGMALGLLSALLAIAPQLDAVRILPVAASLVIILVLGLFVLALAAWIAMRRLNPASLRQE